MLLAVNSSTGGTNLNPNKSFWFLFILLKILVGVFLKKSKDGFKNHLPYLISIAHLLIFSFVTLLLPCQTALLKIITDPGDVSIKISFLYFFPFFEKLRNLWLPGKTLVEPLFL